MTAIEAVRPRVVLADDEPIILEALRQLLEESGCDVVDTATDGITAVELADDLHPDVLVADLRMPGLTGLEVAAQLRKRTPPVPVVILSAYDDVGLQLAAERIPVAAYLVKGCSSRALVAAINAAARPSCASGPPPG
jgi:DNA-binding NarL/FixJ family response regulator